MSRASNGTKRDDASRLLSWIVWGLAAAACLVQSIRLFEKAKYAGADSWLPMARALDFLHSSTTGSVYEHLFFSGHIKFQYPPSGLFLIDLLRTIGLTTPEQYNNINAGLLIATGMAFSGFAVQTLGPVRFREFRIPVAPIAFLIAINFYPNNLAFKLGQMQILLGLLVLLAFMALKNDRRVLCGCLTAAVASVKPQLFLLGLLALWRRDWHFLAGFTAISVVALAISIGLYGLENNLEYLRVITFLSHHGEYHHLNQSINGISNRIFYHGPSVDQDPDNPIPNSGFPPYIQLVYLATIVSSLVMISIPFVVRTRTFYLSDLLSFSAAIVLFTMASPIAWVHHYNFLLPGFVVALRVALDRLQGKQLWLRLAALVASFVLTGFPLMPPFEPTIPALNILQSHVFIGALIFLFALLLEMSAQPPARISQSGLPHS